MVKINYTHLTLVSMQCYLIYHHCRHQWIMLPGKEIPIIHIDVLPVGSLRNGSRLVCLYRRALSWRARTEATVPSHCPPLGEAKVDKKWKTVHGPSRRRAVTQWWCHHGYKFKLTNVNNPRSLPPCAKRGEGGLVVVEARSEH